MKQTKPIPEKKREFMKRKRIYVRKEESEYKDIRKHIIHT